jgi:hypothetical protein
MDNMNDIAFFNFVKTHPLHKTLMKDFLNMTTVKPLCPATLKRKNPSESEEVVFLSAEGEMTKEKTYANDIAIIQMKGRTMSPRKLSDARSSINWLINLTFFNPKQRQFF